MHAIETSLPAPVWTAGTSALYRGDCFPILRAMEPAQFDAVVTDPPYCSGGLMRSDRSQATSEKYVLTGTAMKRPEFSGDSRDQRSFTIWATLWLAECLRLTKPGGLLMVFADWRQLPVMSDALQAGGWVWRGINVWDKTEGARPQRGFFRAQCEYVLLASNGSMGKEQERAVSVCAPGLYRASRRDEDRLHITGKPVGLMHHLLQVLPADARVLDPFVGSGSTMVAALESGRRAVGIEYTSEYAEISATRLNGLLGQAPEARA